MILRPSFSQEFAFYTNWVTTFRADGQWASEPLISIEQFGAGGVNSVRGYHEGEVFGDTGWHLSAWNNKRRRLLSATIYGDAPLTIRGSVYMDYAACLPAGSPRASRQHSALGHWFRIGRLGRVPLAGAISFFLAALSAGTMPAYQPFFNFALTAQF